MAHALVKSLLLDDCGDVKERVAEAHDAEVGGRHDYRVSCAREQLRQTRMSVGRQAAEGVRQGRRHCTFVGCNTNHVDLGTVTFQNGKSPAEARFVWGIGGFGRQTGGRSRFSSSSIRRRIAVHIQALCYTHLTSHPVRRPPSADSAPCSHSSACSRNIDSLSIQTYTRATGRLHSPLSCARNRNLIALAIAFAATNAGRRTCRAQFGE